MKECIAICIGLALPPIKSPILNNLMEILAWMV